MSKKKDPNIILRDKRLRALAQRKKNMVKKTSKFGCPFFDRMVEEDYEIVERVIRLEHFVWKVEIETQGKVYADIIILGEFTDAANALDKKDRDLLIKQHKYMSVYASTLEQRMERICKRLNQQKGK